MTAEEINRQYCKQVVEAVAQGAVVELDPDMLDVFGAPDPDTYEPPFSLEEALESRFDDKAS